MTESELNSLGDSLATPSAETGGPKELSVAASEAERRQNILARLNQRDDSITALGLRIADVQSLASEQFTVAIAQLIGDLRAQGVDLTANDLDQLNQEGELDQGAVAGNLSARVDYFDTRRQQDIFGELPVEKMSPEEGRRRRGVEHVLVVAKAGLLAIGIKDIEEGNLTEGCKRIEASKVDAREYPEWFKEGLEKSLKLPENDLQKMGKDELQALSRLFQTSGMWMDNTPDLEKEPHELTGEAFIHRTCKEAGVRFEAVKLFDDQVAHAREKALAILNHHTWLLPLDSGNQLMDSILRLDQTVWQKYNTGKLSFQGVLEVLKEMSTDDFLNRAAVATVDPSSRSDKKAIDAAKIKAERLIFASALGLLQAHIDSSPTVPNATIEAVMQIVGRRHAKDLMNGENLEKVDPAQLQFKQELDSYLGAQEANKLEAIKNGLALGSKAVDGPIQTQTENAARLKRETAQKLDELEKGILGAKESLEQLPEINGMLEEVKGALSPRQDKLKDYVSVEGEGPSRKLVINKTQQTANQTALKEVESNLSQEQDPKKRAELLGQRAKLQTKLKIFDQLSSSLVQLGKSRREWREGFSIRNNRASYNLNSEFYRESEGVDPSQASNELSEFREEIGSATLPEKLEQVEKRLEAFRSADKSGNMQEMDAAIKEVGEIQAKLAEFKTRADRGANDAIGIAVKWNLLYRALLSLDQAGDSYHEILRYF